MPPDRRYLRFRGVHALGLDGTDGFARFRGFPGSAFHRRSLGRIVRRAFLSRALRGRRTRRPRPLFRRWRREGNSCLPQLALRLRQPLLHQLKLALRHQVDPVVRLRAAFLLLDLLATLLLAFLRLSCASASCVDRALASSCARRSSARTTSVSLWAPSASSRSAFKAEAADWPCVKKTTASTTATTATTNASPTILRSGERPASVTKKTMRIERNASGPRSNGGRRTFQLGENGLLHAPAVLLLGVKRVARPLELDACNRVIAYVLDADGHQCAGERRRLHQLLFHHRRASQPIADVVAEHLDGDLGVRAEVPHRPPANVHRERQRLRVARHRPGHERGHRRSVLVRRGDDQRLSSEQELHELRRHLEGSVLCHRFKDRRECRPRAAARGTRRTPGPALRPRTAPRPTTAPLPDRTPMARAPEPPRAPRERRR